MPYQVYRIANCIERGEFNVPEIFPKLLIAKSEGPELANTAVFVMLNVSHRNCNW